MRKQFQVSSEDLQNLTNQHQSMTMVPISPQEKSFQTMGNIILFNQKKPVTSTIQTLLASYRGSFSYFILTLKYCAYWMEKEINKNFSQFAILKMLTRWVEILQSLKKKKDIRFYSEVIESLELGGCSYEQFIAYLNYISIDLITLMKLGTDESKKKYGDLSRYPYLDSHDLIRFLNVILPKVLMNITVPRTFFPATLLKSTDQNIHILYSQQTLQNILQNKSHYANLLANLIRTLLAMELEAGQIKELILNSFKYYYLFHFDKNHSASQFVIESLKRITSAIRFAINDEISLFIVTLTKLGKHLFLSYLYEKFQWVNELKTTTIHGVSKSTIKPYNNHNFGNSHRIRIEAGKCQPYYIQVYDRFSLIYFYLSCLEHDITIRFYFMGGFGKEEGGEGKRLLFCLEKKERSQEGSIEIVEKGIYMFEFDNSHSWVKGKTVAIEVVVLVPLEIKDQQKSSIKQHIFQKQEHLNEVLPQHVLGWVDEHEIKTNSISGNVYTTIQNKVKIYYIKLVKNTGQVYEYETEMKDRFIKKVKYFQHDGNIFWGIQGCKVKNIEEVYRWINCEFEAEKMFSNQVKKDIGDGAMMEEEINEQIAVSNVEEENNVSGKTTEQQKNTIEEKQQSTIQQSEDKAVTDQSEDKEIKDQSDDKEVKQSQDKEVKDSASESKEQAQLKQQGGGEQQAERKQNDLDGQRGGEQKIEGKQNDVHEQTEQNVQGQHVKQEKNEGDGAEKAGKKQEIEKLEEGGDNNQTKEPQQK